MATGSCRLRATHTSAPAAADHNLFIGVLRSRWSASRLALAPEGYRSGPTVESKSGRRASARLAAAEAVKAFETNAQDFFCASLSIVGWLIHAAVGSLGGFGRRLPNRVGLAA